MLAMIVDEILDDDEMEIVEKINIVENLIVGGRLVKKANEKRCSCQHFYIEQYFLKFQVNLS